VARLAHDEREAHGFGKRQVARRSRCNRRHALAAGHASPVGLAGGAGQRLVMVVPVGHVVDRTPRDLADLVGLRAELAADHAAEIHDRNDAVRVVVRAGLACEHTHEMVHLRDEPHLFGDLAHDGAFRCLVGVDPSGNEPPASVVDAPDQQDAIVLVEDGRVGPDLGRDVAEIVGEAGLYLGDVEAGALRVLARREREQLLVAIAIERVRRVVKSGLRDRADLIEECCDVDGSTLVGDPARDDLRELLTAVFLEEVPAAFDRGVRLTRATRNLALKRAVAAARDRVVIGECGEEGFRERAQGLPRLPVRP
jgi:hypothetical protein